jgi:hypothetical protein
VPLSTSHPDFLARDSLQPLYEPDKYVDSPVFFATS